MRALVCRQWGEVDTLELAEVDPPVPSARQILIETAATAVNYADAIMVAGNYQTKPPFPFSPGLETAGTVLACGDEVTRFRPGDRVMALLHYGGMAEQAVAEESDTWAVPREMNLDDAGAFPIAYFSFDVALRWQGRLEASETLLVLGAAGGVGLTAVEIGKAMGARVIAAASNPQTRRRARARRGRSDRLFRGRSEDPGHGPDPGSRRGCLFRPGRRRAVRCSTVVARMGRTLRPRGVRRQCPQGPGEPPARKKTAPPWAPRCATIGGMRTTSSRNPSPPCATGTHKAS